MTAAVPAMVWTVEPPPFVWQRAKPLRRSWRPLPATPALGELWYGPRAGRPNGRGVVR